MASSPRQLHSSVHTHREPRISATALMVESLGPINISKDDAAVALEAFRCKAILDERERCAKIADDYREKWANAGGFGGHSAAARIIGAVIRANG